jgi:tetratricopeptide (TPR) repeat protein
LAGLAAQGISYTTGKFDLENSRFYTEKALTLARQLGDRFVEARGLWSLLLAHSYLDGQLALAYGEQGLAIARELVTGPEPSQEYLDLLALILMDLTIPLVGVGQVATAAEYASEAREMFEEFGNLPMAATAAQRQGLAFKAEGKFEQALEVYDWSTEIDLSLGNEGGLVGSSLGLFDIYPQIGEMSAHFARMALLRPILVREGRIPVHVCDLQSLVIYLQFGLIDKALEWAEVVWQFRESGATIWPDMFLCHLARAYIKSGDLAAGRKALAALSKDVELVNYIIPLAALLPQARAELALAEGELQEALTIVDDFLTKIRQDQIPSFLPEKLLLKANILCAAGQADAAYEVLQEAHSLALGQGAMPFLWRICAQLAGMEEERGHQAQASAIYADARTAIDFIAAHAGGEDLRAEFLGLPEVRSILEKTGEPV